MVVNIAALIEELKVSSLYAECPCGDEFKLSDAVLFDGTKDFPKEALEAQKLLKEALKAREHGLHEGDIATLQDSHLKTYKLNR